MLQHKVLPFLQYGRCRVPIQRVLKDDDIVFKEPLLFPIDVDLKIGILSVQIDQGYAVEIDNGIRHRAIYLGAIE